MAASSVSAASSLSTLWTAPDESSATMAVMTPSSARYQDGAGVESNLARGMGRLSRSASAEKARPYMRNSSGNVRTTASMRRDNRGFTTSR